MFYVLAFERNKQCILWKIAYHLLIVSRRPKIAKVMCNKSGDVRIKRVKQKKV